MKRALAMLVALFAVDAMALHAMGRPWWCLAGDLALWSGEVQSRHNSQHLADPYTVTHLLHGLGLYAIAWWLLGRRATAATRFLVAISFETLWEIVENTSFIIERYRAATISLDYYGDSVANSLGDISACVIGYLAAGAIPTWVSAVAFFAVDGLMALWIRDGLLLNIVMLIHPIDAIRVWQRHQS